MIELVANTLKKKGIWNSDNFYLEKMKRCNILLEEVKVLFHYPVVSYI